MRVELYGNIAKGTPVDYVSLAIFFFVNYIYDPKLLFEVGFKNDFNLLLAHYI